MLSDKEPLTLSLYATASYPCSYLPNREARSQVATPTECIDTPIYSELVSRGFRRSGDIAYRPWCDLCTACVPVRIPVSRFTPSRSQRRAVQQHDSLTVREQPLLFNQEHFELYCHYQQARHAGGGMDEDTPENYRQFLLSSQVDTRLIEFSQSEAVCMVSIVDVLQDGLSAVYTFFDPRPNAQGQQNSYGTYGILWQIELCRALNLPYLYLGYWVANSPKMDYKRRFYPLEARIEGCWQTLNK